MIKVLIDETDSTEEERKAFYQQPVVGSAIDALASHTVPGVELRVVDNTQYQYNHKDHSNGY